MPERPKPVILIVRDGWGRNPHPEHDKFNAVKLARTPRCDALLERYPWTLIHTSGEDVGLPEGTMGNSEVGHQNLGAGRIVDQESVRITKAIRSGEFFENAALKNAINEAFNAGGKVHLMGIASDAGVHGLLDHLYACLELCKRMAKAGQGPREVFLHLFTDGRDTGPFTGKEFVERIEARCREIGVGRVASIIGRYYAMDRDNRWERVEKAYRVMTGGARSAKPRAAGAGPQAAGAGPQAAFGSAAEAIQDYYDHPTNDSQQGDEFITPRAVAADGDASSSRITDGDTVIFYNYRGDRPREITRAFVMPEFQGHVPPSPDTGEKGFDRGKRLDLQSYVMMTTYEEALVKYESVEVAFPRPPKMTDIAGQYLSDKGLKQFRCAETEKFPHVTFFFNDYRDEPFEGESREMAQSPKVATYDLQPEMSAAEVTKYVLERVNADSGTGSGAGDGPAREPVDFILVNFANGDMVGHTGKLDAAIKAVETVDGCVGQIVDAALAKGGKLIVTADHGNAEQMWDPKTNAPHTAHTTYDVECIVVDPDLPRDTKLREGGRLADVFPTVLTLMGLDQPEAMTGRSLIQ